MKLKALQEAIAALTSKSDRAHELARRQFNPQRAQEFREDADESASHAREISDSIHRSESGADKLGTDKP